jgi:hypothetical protein
MPSPTPTTAYTGVTGVLTVTPTLSATVAPGLVLPEPTATPAPAWGARSRNEGGLTASIEAWLAALPAWVPLVGGAVLLGLVAGSAWLVTRFVRYTGRDLQMKQRMVAESEAARLEERRREVASLLVSKDDWLRVVSQVAADALGRPVQINPEIPPRVGGRPVPYFTLTGEDDTRYVFTTGVRALQGVGLLRRRARPLRLASPVEPGLVWTHLAEKFLREANEIIPAVPRDAAWFLVVVEGR